MSKDREAQLRAELEPLVKKAWDLATDSMRASREVFYAIEAVRAALAAAGEDRE